MKCEVCGKDTAEQGTKHTLCDTCRKAYTLGINDESQLKNECGRMLVDADTVLGYIASMMWTSGFLSCMSQNSVMKYAEQIQTAREVLNEALGKIDRGLSTEIYHANYEGDYKR